MKLKHFTLFLSFFFILGLLAPFISDSISANRHGEEDNFSELEPAAGEQQPTLSIKPAFKHYAISAAHPLAVRAGKQILSRGGTAVDAAIVTQLVLNVVEPQSSGIGGGGFLLYYQKKGDKITSFDGREEAPRKVTGDWFLRPDGSAMDFEEARQGGRSVGVPGLISMMKMAHDKHGKLPWSTLFEQAIAVAENGFPMSDDLYAALSESPLLPNFKDYLKPYLDDAGDIFPPGHLVTNIELAGILKMLSEDPDDFYKGEIAKKIVNVVNSSPINKGEMDEHDLADYQAKERDVICLPYRKYSVCGMAPPSSGGIAVLQALGILEGFHMEILRPENDEEILKEEAKTPFNLKDNIFTEIEKEVLAVHLITEAEKLAFADRNRFVGDPDFVKVPVEELLKRDYLIQRYGLIKNYEVMKEALPGNIKMQEIDTGTTTETPSTTHISVVDMYGNAVALTSSIEYAFGSGLSVNGFLLNNELTDFSFLPEKDGVPDVNRVEPKKRPRSSMSPTIIFGENNKLKAVIGSPGGPRIISYVVQTIVNFLDFGHDIKTSINLPRHVTIGKELEVEEGIDWGKTREELEKMGHKVKSAKLQSGLHGILINDDGSMEAAADRRRDGDIAGD